MKQKNKKGPNIVLITVDCLRYDYLTKELSASAKDSRTPFLKKLSESGVVFDNFYANGSWSGTAMPSILTSTYPFDNSGKCELFGREPSLPQILKEGGYLTFGVHANPYFLSQFGYNRGFDYFYDWFTSSNKEIYEIKLGLKDTIRKLPHINNVVFKTLHRAFNKTIRPVFEKIYPTINIPYPKAEKTNKIAFSCLNYYKEQLRDRPFFLWLHYMDLHEPLLPDKRYLKEGLEFRDIKDLYDKVVKHEGVKLTKKEAHMLQELYLATLSQIDGGTKKIHGFIANELDLKNTIFVITTDHGELLAGKKNYYSHAIWLCQELIHIPLLIGGAGIQHQQSSGLFSQIDLAPSILKMAGSKPPSTWRGKNFLNVNLKPKRLDRDVVLAEEGRVKRDDHIKQTGLGIKFELKWEKRSFAVIKGGYKYIKNFYLNTEEFYDLSRDPNENQNLMNSKAVQKKITSLKRSLSTHIKNYRGYE